MEEFRPSLIFGALVLYLSACLGVGIWSIGRTRTPSDFFMAGRSLGPWVTGLAVFSSNLSGFAFVGNPGLIYAFGAGAIWLPLAGTTAYALAFCTLAKRLRMIAEIRNTLSLPDVVAVRYQSDLTRGLTALAILLGTVGYLATQVLAMALILQSLVENSGFELNIFYGVAASSGVLLFYSVSGGILASVYTSVFQGGIMMAAGLLTTLSVVLNHPGGVEGASQALMAHQTESIGPFGTAGIFRCISWYFLFSLGLSGQPHVITKFMMTKSISEARIVLPLSLFGFLLCALLGIAIGLSMRALVVSGAHPPLDTPDLAASEFLKVYAHPILAGLVFAGVLSAIMSTADSFLNIGAAALVHDIPRAFGITPRRDELFLARCATAFLTVSAAAFALYESEKHSQLVALLGVFGWSTFAAALVPTVAIGLNWKRATARAANCAITFGILMNVFVEGSRTRLPMDIDAGAAALLGSLIIFIGVSLASSPRELPSDIEAVMDL